jgi:VanZ family protein
MQYPRQSVQQRVVRWAPALVYMALIFYSSSQPDPAPVVTRNVWDKLLHGAGYGALALLYVWALAGTRWRWRVIAAAAIVLTSAYAATDEVHQIFTPGRVPEVADWIADTIGGCVAVAIGSAWRSLSKA